MSRIETSKLIELRAKTDRQLVQLIRHRLERGLASERAHRELHALLAVVPASYRAALEPMLAECTVCQAAGA